MLRPFLILVATIALMAIDSRVQSEELSKEKAISVVDEKTVRRVVAERLKKQGVDRKEMRTRVKRGVATETQRIVWEWILTASNGSEGRLPQFSASLRHEDPALRKYPLGKNERRRVATRTEYLIAEMEDDAGFDPGILITTNDAQGNFARIQHGASRREAKTYEIVTLRGLKEPPLVANRLSSRKHPSADGQRVYAVNIPGGTYKVAGDGNGRTLERVK